MSQRMAALVLSLVAALLGCVKQPLHTSPASAIRSAALSDKLCPQDPPNPLQANQVDLIFHGLVSFVFHNDGSVESVFLTPVSHPDAVDPMLLMAEKHLPLCAIDTTWIHSDTKSIPDWIVAGGGDAGRAVWTFATAKLGKDSDVTDTELKYKYFDDDDQTTHIPIKLVPSMDDILGGTPKLNQAPQNPVTVTGTWKLGTMCPVFDEPEHLKDDKWSIGPRTGVIPDGVRIRLQLSSEKARVSIVLNREGHSEPDTIFVIAGGTVLFSDFPQQIPAPSEGIPHFKYYYDLLDHPSNEYLPVHQKNIGPENEYPARCAPSLIYPPADWPSK